MKHVIPCLALFLSAAAAGETNELLRKALFAEEVELDQAKASALYQEIIAKMADAPRQLAAARYHLARIHLANHRRPEAEALLRDLVADAAAPADWAVQARALLGPATAADRADPDLATHPLTALLKGKLWNWHYGANLHGPHKGTIELLPDGRIESTFHLLGLIAWSPVGDRRFQITKDNGEYHVFELSKDGSEAVALALPGVVDAKKRLALHPAPGKSLQDIEIEYLAKLVESAPDRIGEDENLRVLTGSNRRRALAFLFDKGVSPDIREVGGFRRPLVMLAAQYGDVETLKFVLDRGPSVNATDKHNETALFAAIATHRKDSVALLLERGATIVGNSSVTYEAWRDPSNLLREVATPLHSAGLAGDPEIARLLLDRGADIHAISPKKSATPLTAALDGMHWEVAKLFLARGADPNLPANGKTNPLRQMVHEDQRDMVKLLLEKGARVDLQSEEPMQSGGLSRSIASPLHVAAREGRLEMARLLVAAGCPVDLPAPQSLETPLHAAALRGNKEICQWLLEQGADINHRLADNLGSQSSWTPLHSAVWSESLEVSKLLLEKGAAAGTACGERGMQRNAFHLAVLKGSLPLVKLILERPAFQSPEARELLLSAADARGNTPLHLAVSREAEPDADLVRFLLESGGPTDKVNQQGLTPRQLASDPTNGTRESRIQLLLVP